MLVLGSCETNLDISSVAEKKRLVVNALLNDQETVRIEVGQSTSIGDSVKPKPIENAVVTIKDDAGVVSNCAYNPATGYYESTTVPMSGKSYFIIVKALNFPDAFATVVIPQPASLQKSTWKDSTNIDSSGFPTGTITVTVDDKGNEQNYYRITLYYWNALTAQWNVLGAPTSDAEIGNNAIKTADGGIIFNDKVFNGSQRKIDFITPNGFQGQSPKFLVVSESLSYEYYTYFKSLDDYKNGGGIFSEPPAVFSNISNGLGIAAASSMRKDFIL